ncbi:MAG TPA: cellulose synthase operon protein YhjQ/BcsQ [Candidatus Limnocylindria bacterium]
MTRAAICGGEELRSACDVLQLESSNAPRIVLVDLREPGAAAEAARFGTEIPRIVIADAEQSAVIGAFGGAALVATSADPAVLGPLVARAIPRATRERTRVVSLTAARGGTGRTMAAANLAQRLAEMCTVLAVDATGTGALGWWLRAEPRPWAELEVLAGELRPEHLELVRSAVGARLSIVGGAPTAPSPAVLLAVIAAAQQIADVVLVDLPLLADERSRQALSRSDRRLVLAYPDAASTAALSTAELPADPWIVAAQGPIDGAFRVLPRDEDSVADAIARSGVVGGALGRAYDELAELLAIDAS